MHPGPGLFLTLTYDDEHVPRTLDCVLTLHKSEFQAWLKSALRTVGRFRYYAVGEYGDDTLRPHYHMAIFPNSHSQAKQFTNLWTAGFTSCYELNSTRAEYLADYTTKKLTSDTDERLVVGQEPEFRTSSRVPGLGAAFIPVVVSAYRTKSGKAIITERGDIERTVRIGGKIYPLPRYIANKARKTLGVPLTHEERLCHEGYYFYHHQIDFAERDEAFLKIEEKQCAEKKQKRWRSQTINV